MHVLTALQGTHLLRQIQPPPQAHHHQTHPHPELSMEGQTCVSNHLVNSPPDILQAPQLQHVQSDLISSPSDLLPSSSLHGANGHHKPRHPPDQLPPPLTPPTNTHFPLVAFNSFLTIFIFWNLASGDFLCRHFYRNALPPGICSFLHFLLLLYPSVISSEWPFQMTPS